MKDVPATENGSATQNDSATQNVSATQNDSTTQNVSATKNDWWSIKNKKQKLFIFPITFKYHLVIIIHCLILQSNRFNLFARPARYACEPPVSRNF